MVDGRPGIRPSSTINLNLMQIDAVWTAKVSFPSGSGDELVVRDVEEDGAEGPDRLCQEVAEDHADAEGEGLHVETVAAVAEDGELADPGDQVVEPEARPGAGLGDDVADGVERPPEERRP